MEDLQRKDSHSLVQGEVPLVTSRLFEAYLACPTKCYLQSIGEAESNNDFSIWKETRSESYCREGIERLTFDSHSQLDIEPSETGGWKNVSWRFTVNRVIRNSKHGGQPSGRRTNFPGRNEQIIQLCSDPF